MTCFRFADYTLRQVEAADREQLERWIAADPHHRDTAKAEFFQLVLEDAAGACYYVELEPAMRVHIQFGPSATQAERERTMRALGAGMKWLRAEMGGRGVKQLIFSSSFRPLIAFCVKRLGFRRSLTELLCPTMAPVGAEAAAQQGKATSAEVLTAEESRA